MTTKLDSWATEDAEFGFPPPGDTGRHDAQASKAGNHRLKEMLCTGQAGAESEFTMLPSFVFLSKLLRDL
jgi:hypothetical protein